MNRLIPMGAAIFGGVVAAVLVSGAPRRMGASMRRRMFTRMEHMMASLPEGSPPRLVMSVLPRLREQNDEIIAMLREQNELLRKHLESAG